MQSLMMSCAPPCEKLFSANGLKLSQLEDVDFSEHHAANAKPDPDCDFEHDSGTVADSLLVATEGKK